MRQAVDGAVFIILRAHTRTCLDFLSPSINSAFPSLVDFHRCWLPTRAIEGFGEGSIFRIKTSCSRDSNPRTSASRGGRLLRAHHCRVLIYHRAVGSTRIVSAWLNGDRCNRGYHMPAVPQTGVALSISFSDNCCWCNWQHDGYSMIGDGRNTFHWRVRLMSRGWPSLLGGQRLREQRTHFSALHE